MGERRVVASRPGRLQPGRRRAPPSRPGRLQPEGRRGARLRPGRLQAGRRRGGRSGPGRLQPGRRRAPPSRPGRLQPEGRRGARSRPGRLQAGRRRGAPSRLRHPRRSGPSTERCDLGPAGFPVVARSRSVDAGQSVSSRARAGGRRLGATSALGSSPIAWRCGRYCSASCSCSSPRPARTPRRDRGRRSRRLLTRLRPRADQAFSALRIRGTGGKHRALGARAGNSASRPGVLSR